MPFQEWFIFIFPRHGKLIHSRRVCVCVSRARVHSQLMKMAHQNFNTQKEYAKMLVIKYEWALAVSIIYVYQRSNKSTGFGTLHLG